MNVDDLPGLSVIIPCFNMGRFLAEAVDSVRAQGHDRMEIIVVDDGSSDDTGERVKGLRGPIEYVHQDNRGPAAARNHGLSLARQPLISFLDADDLWPEEKLKVQWAALRAEPELDFVLGNQRGFALRAGAAEAARDYEFDDPFFIFLVGCGLYHRRVFDAVGSFDESMRYSEDTDWFFRCREARARYKLLPEVGIFYRKHDSSMTHGRDAIGKGFLSAIKKSIDRRRASGQRELEWMYGDRYSPKGAAPRAAAGGAGGAGSAGSDGEREPERGS